jgi:integrase
MQSRVGSPKLLHQLRLALRVHHYSPRTEQAYVGWVRRYVRYHGLRHPGELRGDAIREFLTALADRAHLSASSQTQALSALIFLYREVLHVDPGAIGDIVRAKQPARLPVVLTREEVRALLDRLQGIPRVVCILLYGSGLRLLEALQLRVKDLDFSGGEIRVRRAKGAKDRVTVLPGGLTVELKHLSSGCGGCTKETWPEVQGRLRYLTRSSGSRRARRRIGGGNTSFLRRGAIGILRETTAGITCTSRRSSARCALRPRRRASLSG